jgi:outer membrane immunogenic protein
MKKLITLAVLLAMSAPLTAFAADLPMAPPPPPRAPAFVPPPLFTWTGFYIGVNGGYAWGNWSDGTGDSFKSNGGIVGGTLGFNYQWDWFVAGVEADIDWSDQKFSQSTAAGGTIFGTPVVATSTFNYKNDVVSTFAGRFGVAADHWLFYGKAGGAWTQENFNQTASLTIGGVGVTGTGSNTFSRLGWMAGAGVEYAFTSNLTGKIEYNFLDFGSNNENLTFAGATIPITSKLHDNVVKVGLNWLFNGT